MELLISEHSEQRIPTNNGQKLEDRKKIVQIPCKNPSK